jgi:UDP:flavonoid glycosyltransferase YjiC (YdhE family)
MTSRRVVFFSWGNGAGHITRLLDLADRALAEDWKTVIATPVNRLHLQLIEQSGHAFVCYPEDLVPTDPHSCWTDRDFLDKSFYWDSALLRSTKPLQVVHDSRLPTMIAAAESNISYASICQEVQLPGFAFPGLGTSPVWTRPVQTVNARLQRSGLAGINGDMRELYIRDRILVPSVPEIDSIPEALAANDIVYVGPLRGRVATTDQSRVSSAQDEITERRIFFYRTVGPGTDYRGFVDAFGDMASRIYIATGNPEITAYLREALRGHSFNIATFVDVDELAPHLGAGVIHGGHGVSLTFISAGVPVVILPGSHPERAQNGRRLAVNGFGKVFGPHASLALGQANSVDVTGEVPEWRIIRDAVNELLDVGLSPAARAITQRINAELRSLSFSEIIGLRSH